MVQRWESASILFTIEVSQTVWTTTLSCREAQICCQPPALQLRVQDIILFHNDHEITWCEETVGNFLICHHQPNTDLLVLMRRLSSEFFATGKGVEFSDVCDKCNTDYQVELRAFNGELAFTITRWIDLGSGIKPIDLRWTVHAQWIPKYNSYRTSLDPSDKSHSPRAFEDACGTRNSLDYLRSRNLAYLKDGNYKKIMKRRWFSASRWYLWQKDLC